MSTQCRPKIGNGNFRVRSTGPRPTTASEAGEAGDECVLDSKSSNTRRSGGSGVCRRRRCCTKAKSAAVVRRADQSPTALGYASAGRRRRCLAGSCEKKQITIHTWKRSARRSGAARLTLTSHEFCIRGPRAILRAAAAVQTTVVTLAPSLSPFLLCPSWRFACRGHSRRRIQPSCSPWQRHDRLMAAARAEGDR